MTRKLFVALAILSLSASAASAAHHHHHALNAQAGVQDPAAQPPMGWTGGPNSSSDHATYLKNLHDSGYNPKNDFDASGHITGQ